MKAIYEEILQRCKSGKKSLAVLVDPDKTENLAALLEQSASSPPDYFFVGGSLLDSGNLDKCIAIIRSGSKIPILLFPGSEMQISSSADALLLLSVISGRNPELLIGRHVAAAGMIRASGLEIIPTGYILVESGSQTTVSYISNTQPVPRKKNTIAAVTALAGEQLGLKIIYLEAGSGAELPVPVEMIAAVKKTIRIPLIAGGGLKTKADISARLEAGADLVVVGNILEHNPNLLPGFADAVHAFNA
jgi:phosphoglycerol geranylgeranyltransferase